VGKGLGDIQQKILRVLWVARDHAIFRRPVYYSLNKIFEELDIKNPTAQQRNSYLRAIHSGAEDGTFEVKYNYPKIYPDLPRNAILAAAPLNASPRATTLKANKALQGRGPSRGRTIESVFKDLAGPVTVIAGSPGKVGTHEGKCPRCPAGEIRTVSDADGLCEVHHEQDVNAGARSMDNWAKWQTAIPIDRFSKVRHSMDDWSPPKRAPETHREAAGYWISSRREESDHLWSGSYMGKPRRKPPGKAD
jgi:hypothetical protein